MDSGKQQFEGPQPKRFFEGWMELRVVTFGRDGRTPDRAATLELTRLGELDIHLQGNPGVSRRMKQLFMRLEKPAARALYEMLRARFEVGSDK
jgi:hypothetical protein